MGNRILIAVTSLIIVTFSVTVSMSDLKEGLVAYWPFDGDAEDIVGGLDVEVEGDPTWVSGRDAKVGAGSLAMDGIDDRILAGTFNPSEETGELTVALWANLNEHKATMFLKKGDDWSDNGMMWQFEMDASGDLSIGRSGSAPWFGVVMPLKEWVHLAVTVADEKATLYMNGNYVNDGQFIMGTGTDSTLRIAATQNPHRFVDGMIDEVMLYNRALTPEEVRKLAEGVDSTTILPVEPAGKLAKTWAGLKSS